MGSDKEKEKMSNKRTIFAHIVAICVVCFTMMICDIQPIYAKEADIYSNINDYLQKCVKNANIPARSVSIVNKNEVLFIGDLVKGIILYKHILMQHFQRG